MDIFEELGVNAYVNAHEWFTSQGGSMLPPPVVQAMAEASQKAVRLIELHNAVGEAIARLTRNEAACVTCSATGGILLAVAAFMSELDPKKAYQLPDTRGLKNEVILQKCDHFGEEWAIRMPGAQFVDIGAADVRKGRTTGEELQEAITPRTAAVFTTPPAGGMLPLDEIIRIARDRGVGVIVDIAWSLPPKENLWTFTREYGADVVIVSGGKGLRGPQASGLILGKKEVVQACHQMSSPYGWPGRPMKVGREAMVGVYAAVKHLLNGGAEATQQMAEYIARELEDIPGISVSLDKPHSQVHLKLSPSRFRLTARQIREKLLTEEPRVMITDNDNGPNGLRVNAGTLAEGQEQLVARRVKETLLGALRE
jgi:D-glucosaminate-6-phosphate ammonia-lyase